MTILRYRESDYVKPHGSLVCLRFDITVGRMEDGYTQKGSMRIATNAYPFEGDRREVDRILAMT